LTVQEIVPLGGGTSVADAVAGMNKSAATEATRAAVIRDMVPPT
jgi:hypothetical protein